MKKNNLFLFLYFFAAIFFNNNITAQSKFYYYRGEKIPLTVSTEKILVKFSDSLTFKQKSQIIASNFSLKPIKKSENDTTSDVLIVELEKGKSVLQIEEITIQLNKNTKVVIANSIFLYKDNTLVGITDEFVVKLKSPFDYSELERIAKETNTQIVRQNQFDPSIYTLNADKNTQGNALEIANYFFETKKFEFAVPNFLGFNIIDSYDPYYSDQWSLENTGQYGGISGADMDVHDAWAITMGRDDIKVAVVDEGVDLVHPDLIDNILPGYDADEYPIGHVTNGSPTGNDAHGTACAGIIAAKANHIGIAGVCPNCKILPVRSFSLFHSDATCLADGINWAANPLYGAADVISCSWHFIPDPQIENAINYALTSGRNGLGCVVLFSAGNYNSSVEYPAYLPGVIAVGAMSMCNERKRSSSDPEEINNDNVTPDPQGVSCDGENRWGSSYGSELDVVAPGVKISTTDISGPMGYDNVPNMEMYDYKHDYVKNFGGTSAACPNAAGVCALILSINPCLSQSEVKQILELSCSKVGAYCYNAISGHPNGTWNNEMGYGRVNAYNAVRYAFSTQINTYNTSGFTNYIAHNDFAKRTIIAGGCLGLASGVYFVNFYELTKDISFPYTPSPYIFGTASGLSLAEINSGNPYLEVNTITPTSATLKTYIWQVYDINFNFAGWFPVMPCHVTWDYAIVSILNKDLYFQNQNVTGIEVHNAMNKIEAGSNVTNAVPVGDYVIEPGANVTFHAGNTIIMKPGFHAKEGSYFHAYVDPFFTCTQYPNWKLANTNTNYPPVIKDYVVTKLKDTTTTQKGSFLIRNFPNPFNNSTTIEYRIKESQSVKITIYDKCGQELIVLTNKTKHEAGTYQIKFDGISLHSGIYFYTLETDNYKETKQMIKVE